MNNPGVDVIYPSPEEDAQLLAAAMSDPDNLPLTDDEWEAVKPFIHVESSPGADLALETLHA